MFGGRDKTVGYQAFKKLLERIRMLEQEVKGLKIENEKIRACAEYSQRILTACSRQCRDSGCPYRAGYTVTKGQQED